MQCTALHFSHDSCLYYHTFASFAILKTASIRSLRRKIIVTIVKIVVWIGVKYGERQIGKALPCACAHMCALVFILAFKLCIQDKMLAGLIVRLCSANNRLADN